MEETIRFLKIIFCYLMIPLVYLLCFQVLELVFNQLETGNQLMFFRELIMMVLSGLFSATVAYIVSSIRVVQEQKKLSSEKSKKNNRIKKLLKLEIISNKDSLEKLKNRGFSPKNKEVFESQLSFVIYDRYIDKVILDDDTLMLLIKMNKNFSFFLTLLPEMMSEAEGRVSKVLKDLIEKLE